MTDSSVEDAGITLTDPEAYADENRLHRALSLLRREAPVFRVEAPGYEPFWAITRHADVMRVDRDAATFLNAPRQILAPAALDVARREKEMGVRTLIHLDGREHRAFRSISADRFHRAAVEAVEPTIGRLARRYVEQMADYGGECDFVEQVAAPYTLHVIMTLLGLPGADFPLMRKLTKELFGPEYVDGRDREPQEDLAVQRDFFNYFHDVVEGRRARPSDDLVSVIANATVDGRLLSDTDAVSYCVLMLTAGHDTTSFAISGGLRELIDDPAQLSLLRNDRDLLPCAMEEMIRWVTPTKGFMRTAAVDCQVHGTRIKEGDALLLCYTSANRDETVFSEPVRFDVERNPNPHLSFGRGVHACLGISLARQEMHALFAELLPRLESVELAGPPELTASTFVGGLKSLPLRYRLRTG